jgi:transcriptional regulator with XRE-family HTH domain
MARETMGQHLVDLRKSAGFSQRQLARAMGVPLGTLRNWEHDRRFPGLLVGVRLARALGVTVEQLVGSLADSPEPEPKRKPRKPGRK